PKSLGDPDGDISNPAYRMVGFHPQRRLCGWRGSVEDMATAQAPSDVSLLRASDGGGGFEDPQTLRHAGAGASTAGIGAVRSFALYGLPKSRLPDASSWGVMGHDALSLRQA